MNPVDDTIAGIASAHGGAIRGIIRLSGPQVIDCLERCFDSLEVQSLKDMGRATAVAGWLSMGAPLAELPGQLYLWPTSRSYTGQAAAEWHTIGSPPLLEAALRTLCECGARLAAPGEFTLRAFLAGRLDLTQAEAVLGVIDARERAELDVALEQLAGGLGRPLHQLRDQLLDLLAHLEAGLDFVEDEIEFISIQQLHEQLQAAARQVAETATQLSARAQVDDGLRIVLLGQPNVGKSSLFNALVDQSAAIVSSTAGTTRDYLTASLSWDRGQALLVDTAGLDGLDQADDVSLDDVSKSAQRMTGTQRQQADLRLLCLDATRPPNEREQAIMDACDEQRLVVLTKSDVAGDFIAPEGAVVTSSMSGQGLPELRQRIRDFAEARGPAWGAAVPATATRCHDSLRLAAESLRRALRLVEQRSGEELVALEVRLALDELATVVGAVYTDDLLDRIFSRFCIGK